MNKLAGFLGLLAAGIGLATIGRGGEPQGKTHVLWYDAPASSWEAALPLGNGRVAAMVFGGTDRERIALNEDTLTSGEPPADLRSVNVTATYPEVRALLADGKPQEAEAIIKAKWLGRNQQSYQPLGDLWLEIEGGGEVTDYRRWLDLETAIAGVSYVREGARFSR
ncbi:MAG TPA: glycoside hydrolase family 95 protein, partial [Opitutus sp.]|nr:glycoside hydrolase family 95 protein [Opitutus sp.]